MPDSPQSRYNKRSCRMQIAAKPHLRLIASSFFFFISAISSLAYANEFTVSSHPAKLQLPPGQPVERAPTAKPGLVLFCNRVHIRGLSRLRHLNRFAHSVKVKVDAIQAHPGSRIPTLEICFHRNTTVGVGMCPAGAWEKGVKGSWVQSMSPYDSKILDLCVQGSQSTNLIEVSTEEEFLPHRVIFLVIGVIMMASAHFLSESLVFYYGSAMALGVFLVVLIILYQGMRLLPTNRKSSLAIFMYSSIVGVATFLLNYLSGLLRSILVEIGISEDMHNPLAIFFLVCVALAGAWLGFWGVRKLVLDEEGSVDKSVAYFVEWSISIFAASMILQSSLDTVLALEALVFGIAASAILRSSKKFRFVRRFFRGIAKRIHRSQIHTSPSKYSDAKSPRHFRMPGLDWTQIYESPSKCSDAKSTLWLQKRGSDPLEYIADRITSASRISPVTGSTKRRRQTPIEEETYYSTFHNTPDRKRFSKEGWEAFTRDSTTKAMKELSSSPDFAQWVAANAERITVIPAKEGRGEEVQRCWFNWF